MNIRFIERHHSHSIGESAVASYGLQVDLSCVLFIGPQRDMVLVILDKSILGSIKSLTGTVNSLDVEIKML